MQFHITSDEGGFSRQLEAASRGLFFVWIGVAILLDVGWGWGLIGVAAIILTEAAIRWLKGVPVQGFWLAVGVMLLACGIWQLFAISRPLLPLLIIGFGLVVLLGAFGRPHAGAR